MAGSGSGSEGGGGGGGAVAAVVAPSLAGGAAVAALLKLKGRLPAGHPLLQKPKKKKKAKK